LISAYHSAGIKLLVSAFGATEFPTSAGLDANTTCTELANFALANNLDGVDLDWEDSTAFENGSGEAWLITCTKAIRAILPQGKYILSHAPQAPYFTINPKQYPNGAYIKIHKEVGSMIDYYNVQFYNQGSSTYDTYTSLFVTANGWATQTSVKEMIANGIEGSKIIIGKPVTTGDATNTGYVSATNLAAYI
jgi:chitinase